MRWWRRCTPAITCSARTMCTAAQRGCSTRSCATTASRFEYVDTGNLDAVAAAIKANTKLIHVETPTNPLMSLTDIAAVCAIAHAKGVEVSVDNTFMSPALQSPIALGADIVMHSTTKFLNGHSDGLGGALIGTKPEHKERFWLVQKAAGGILSPFECFLVLRGIKTLPLRMKQHEENGRAVAEFLATQPKMTRLAYPGLKSHPQHALAVKQQRGFGSMLSFDLGTREAAGRFLGAVKLFLNAESLGGVESLASHSATTTHAALSDAERDTVGITEGLVRLVRGHRGQGRPDCGSGAGAEQLYSKLLRCTRGAACCRPSWGGSSGTEAASGSQ